jgi:response regulator of citrate/malate metabolism
MRARFRALKTSENRGDLDDAGRLELDAMTQTLDREEEAALATSLARRDLAIERLTHELVEAREAEETLEQVAAAQRALRDEAREYLGQLRARRLALVERARVVVGRGGSAR